MRLVLIACLAAGVAGCDVPLPPFAGQYDGCRPATCASLGFDCDAVPDGCGGMLACGTCASGVTCGSARAHVCGMPCTHDAACVTGEVCDLGTGQCTTGCRTGDRVALDVTRARLTLAVTLDGGPPPAAASTFLQLRSTHLDAAYTRYAPTMTLDRSSLWIVPGEYDVILVLPTRASDAAAWPIGADRARIGHVTVPREGASLTLDVRSAEVDLAVTLDAAPLPATLSGRGSPSVVLTGTLGGVGAIPLCGPDGPSGTLTCDGAPHVRVLRDHYDVGYRGPLLVNGDTVWPRNADEPRVAPAIDATADGVIAIDVPRSIVTVEVTYEGAPLVSSTDPSFASPTIALTRQGRVIEGALFTGTSLPPAHHDPAPIVLPLIAGSYTVSYVEPAAFASAPAMWPELPVALEVARVLDANETLTYDVVPRTIDYTITANGVGATADCVRLNGPRGPSTGSLLLQDGAYPTLRALLDCAPPWPDVYAARGPLAPDLVVHGDAHLAIDLPVVALSIDVEVGGVPLPVQPEGHPSWGVPAISLMPRPPLAPAASLASLDIYQLAMPVAHHDVRVIAGSYDIVFGPGQNNAALPITPATLAHARVIDTDAVMTIDIPSRRVTITPGVVGLAPGADSGEAFLELVRREESSTFPPGILLLSSRSDAGVTTLPAVAIETAVVPGTYDLRWVATASTDGAPGGVADLGCWTVAP